MSRILVCTLLVALLSGGPAVALLSAGPAAALPSAGPVAAPDALPPALRNRSAPPGADSSDDGTASSASKFGWPLPGFPVVVRAFQAPAHRFGPGHRGVDLAGVTAAPVLAAGAGTVVFAGPVAGRGVVSVQHPGGLRTTYEPVSPTVTAGDLVTRGQRIGTVQAGHHGCPVPACLHWGARRGMDYLDPLHLLALGRVRLLPWVGPAADGPFSRRSLRASCSAGAAPPECAAGTPATR